MNVVEFVRLNKEVGMLIYLCVMMVDFLKNCDSIKCMEDFWVVVEGVNIFNVKLFVMWDGFVDIINEFMFDGYLMKDCNVCNFLWFGFSIMYNGDVVVCCYDYDGKYVVGNVFENFFMEIWNGFKMVYMWVFLVSGVVVNKMC